MHITVQHTIAAPLERMWNAASDDWYTLRAQVDLRVGGHFSSRMEAKDGSMGFDFDGIYTEIVSMQGIASRIGERQLLVLFSEGTDGVTVTETFDAAPTHSLAQQRMGWQSILDRFAAHVLRAPHG